jgi:hypothetical protein
MTLADVLAVAAGLVIAGAGFASLSVILAVLFPAAVARARLRAETRPGASAGIGAAAAFGAVVGGAIFLKAPLPPLHLGAVGAFLIASSLAVRGGAGLAAALGQRSRAGAPAAPGPAGILDLLRGALLLEAASLLPLVGWFVVLPAALFVSLGAGIASVFSREPQPAPSAPASEPARS